MISKASAPLSILILAAGAIIGCERDRPADRETARSATQGTDAVPVTDAPTAEAARAEIIDREGRRIGEAALTEADPGVRVAVQASGLPPGPKGFHIHETGRCDPPAFESAGGHMNPTGREHGFENPRGPHAGDLPNLPVREDGEADTTVVAREVTLRPDGRSSLLREGGTALVIHERPDDYRTDPSGESGDRIACGVIERP